MLCRCCPLTCTPDWRRTWPGSSLRWRVGSPRRRRDAASTQIISSVQSQVLDNSEIKTAFKCERFLRESGAAWGAGYIDITPPTRIFTSTKCCGTGPLLTGSGSGSEYFFTGSGSSSYKKEGFQPLKQFLNSTPSSKLEKCHLFISIRFLNSLFSMWELTKRKSLRNSSVLSKVEL